MLKTVTIFFLFNLLISAQVPPSGDFKVEPFNNRIYRYVRGGKVLWTDTGAWHLYYGENNGATIENYYDFNGKVAHGVRNAFICTNDNIIVVGDSLLYYSPNHGKDFYLAKEKQTGAPVRCLYWHNSKSIDEGNEIVMFAEYGPDGIHPGDQTMNRYVWRSEDFGVTWDKVLTKGHELDGKSYDRIRHFHTCVFNKYTNSWLVTAGDIDRGVQWLISSDNGDNWYRVNRSDSQKYRTLSTEFTEDKQVIWGTDHTGSGSAIFSAEWESLYDSTRVINNLLGHQGQVYNLWLYNKQILFTEKVDANSAHLPKIYYSPDLGSTWKTVLEWHKQDNNDAGFLQGCGVDNKGRVYIRLTSNLLGYSDVKGVAITFPNLLTSQDTALFVEKNTICVLEQNYPNPFNPSTKIKFHLENEGKIVIEVHDVLGKKVLKRDLGFYRRGTYETQLDMSDYRAGIYYYTLKISGQSFTRKMIHAK